MTPHFRAFEHDPAWYRAIYSLAAHRLHSVSDAVEVHERPLRKRTAQLVEDLGRAPDADPVEALVAARSDAETLIAVSDQALADAGRRWVGRKPVWHRALRPPPGWHRILGRPRSPASNPDVAEFLERVMEPAAVILLLSIRVELERRSEAGDRGLTDSLIERALAAGGGDFTCDRRAGPRRESLEARERYGQQKLQRDPVRIDDDWLLAYFDILLREGHGPSGRWRRLLAWGGAVRLRPIRPPSYRALYNAACLLSRLAHEHDGFAGLVTASASQLKRAFAELPPGARRDLLSTWAWRDPGLVALHLEPVLLSGIVGPWRAPKNEPEEAEEEKEQREAGEDEEPESPGAEPEDR